MRRFCWAGATLKNCWSSGTDLVWGECFGSGRGDNRAFASAGVDATGQTHDTGCVRDRLVWLGVRGNDLNCCRDSALQVGEVLDIRLLTWGEEPVMVEGFATSPDRDCWFREARHCRQCGLSFAV